MKNILRFLQIFFILITLLLSNANAQSLSFIMHQDTVNGEPDDELSSFFQVENSSTAAKNLKIKTEVIHRTPGHVFEICDLNSCFSDISDMWESPAPFTMQAKENTGGFLNVYCIANNVKGQSIIKITIFVVEEPLDKIEYTAVFNVGTVGIKDQTAGATILSIAPNPVSDYLILDYKLLRLSENSSFNIFNSSGALISQIPINNNTEKTKIDVKQLPAGQYFLSMVTDGKVKQTMAFIVLR